MSNINLRQQFNELFEEDMRKKFISYSLDLYMNELYWIDKKLGNQVNYLKELKVNKKNSKVYMISFISVDSPILFNRLIICSEKSSRDDIEAIVFNKFRKIKEVKNIQELGKAIKSIK